MSTQVRFAWITSALLLLGAIAYVSSSRGMRTCSRCCATQGAWAWGPLVLGGEATASPTRAQFEREHGACTQHTWVRTGCWYGFKRVECTELRNGTAMH